MVPMPSGAVSRITSTGKRHFSSHSAALGARRSLAKASAVSWIAACSSVRAKCMGSGPVGEVEDVGFVTRTRELVDETPVYRDQWCGPTHGKNQIETIVGRVVELAADAQRIAGRVRVPLNERNLRQDRTQPGMGLFRRYLPRPNIPPKCVRDLGNKHRRNDQIGPFRDDF